MIARLSAVVADATQSFEDYDYARALERVESFFWWYCDYYLELVKGRRYDSGDAARNGSAAATAGRRSAARCADRCRSSSACSRRFCRSSAEEVWSWWQQGSVHRASWPSTQELDEALGDVPADDAAAEDTALAVAADVLKEVRKAKSQAQRPMRAPVLRVVVHDSAERLAAMQLGCDDLRQAGSIAAIETVEADEFAVEVELAERAAAGCRSRRVEYPRMTTPRTHHLSASALLAAAIAIAAFAMPASAAVAAEAHQLQQGG